MTIAVPRGVGEPARLPGYTEVWGGRFVLPVLHALGRASGDARLAERTLALYRRYPATATNRVTREMARQLGGPNGAAHARSACRQQGLIHLYRHWWDAHD